MTMRAMCIEDENESFILDRVEQTQEFQERVFSCLLCESRSCQKPAAGDEQIVQLTGEFTWMGGDPGCIRACKQL